MPTIAEQWEKEGIEKGMEKGQLIGSIRSFQEVLGRDVDSPEQLSQLDTEELQSKLDELRRHLPPRGQT